MLPTQEQFQAHAAANRVATLSKIPCAYWFIRENGKWIRVALIGQFYGRLYDVQSSKDLTKLLAGMSSSLEWCPATPELDKAAWIDPPTPEASPAE